MTILQMLQPFSQSVPTHRRRRSAIALLAVSSLLITASLATVLIAADDDNASLVDAKRQTISDLLRRNNYTQVIALSNEIIDIDPTRYQDHLNLARALDRLGKRDLAVGEYKTVRDLLPTNGGGDEVRTVRAEVDRRIKSLDPMDDRLQAAFADFDKKLKSLARTAEESRDKAAMDRIEQMREQVAGVDPARSHFVLDVPGTVNWLDTGLALIAGQKYSFVATGTWGREPYPKAGSDADGVPGSDYRGGHAGALMGTIAGKDIFPLGKKGTFIASRSGILRLAINDGEDSRGDNWGKLHVYVGIAPDEEDKTK